MRRIKNIFILLMAVLLSTLTLVGCGEPKVTPEDSAKTILDIIIKNDKSNIDKVGITEKEYTNIRESFEGGLMKGISSSGLDESILTDEVKNKLKSDILTGLSKVSYEIGAVSKEKDSAKVEIKIKGFDMDKISKTAEDKLKKEYEDNQSMTEKQIYQESFKIVGEEIAKGTFVENPKTVTLTFTKENNVWMPKESELVDLMKEI
ncbi:DUF5105 domain-containing protein [Clostridium manihotivorum]|uniref:DUF5105 domain-containing protein n=1 Tax=Clostridium manihotivorum TaxID=2320868 RepID=A0A3R5R0N1_9CLOT|nr:DUF5105 domain-containing protein [Clostridium manihotivorum]QAA33891.1 DUF5105 domain-containing protein [Clostridium manihotivorum]